MSKRTQFTHTFFVLNMEHKHFPLHKCSNSSTCTETTKKRPRFHSFNWGPSPPLSTKVDTDVIQNGPPLFLHTASDKNWTVERPGNEAIYVTLYLQAYIERGFFKFTYGAHDTLVEFLHADNFCQAHIKVAEACTSPQSPVV